MNLARVQPIALSVAFALAVFGFVVEVFIGHVVVGTMSAVLVVSAAVDYWRTHLRPESPKNAEVVHRLALYVAILALVHVTGLDVVKKIPRRSRKVQQRTVRHAAQGQCPHENSSLLPGSDAARRTAKHSAQVHVVRCTLLQCSDRVVRTARSR